MLHGANCKCLFKEARLSVLNPYAKRLWHPLKKSQVVLFQTAIQIKERALIVTCHLVRGFQMHLNSWINVVIVTHIRTLSLASPPGCPIRWIRQNMTSHHGMYLCIIWAWLLDQHLCKLMKMLLVISSVFEMYRATSNLTFIWTMYCRHFEKLRCFILVSYLLCESCE